MAGPFNPYYVWFGIPPGEQPANRYRLLGVPLFESNPDVIDNAADQRTAHLRTVQSSKNGKLAEQLLNEVAAARVCLLDAKKKAAYDQELRAKLAAQSPAPVPTATQPAAAGSAIQRQPPRRPTDAAPATSIAVAAALPQPAGQWDDLLGKPEVKSPTGMGGKSAKSASANRAANSRNISIGITAGVVLIAALAFGIYALNSPSEGTLVFDWPDRADVAVTVDNAPIEVPASGSWEHSFPAGPHHVAAQRPAFKFATDVNLAAGQRLSVPDDWKPKATLVLSWPPALRSGAVLKVDGHSQTISQHDPMEVPVEPGRHTIQITRPGFDPIGTSATIAPDGRELVSIAAPLTTAKLVLDWPAEERKDAKLIVDGRSQTVVAESDSAPFELTLRPGRHVVHIARTGFESFNQAIELSAGTEIAIKPTWTPEKKAAPMVADTPVPVDVAPQPAKKLPVPAAAEQEKIAKQLNDLYKISQPGPKDLATAQELYDVAAKDGSSPAERYMLLVKGAEIAATAGDLNLSLQGIDTLDADYDIDALEAKQKLLEKFIAAGRPDQMATAIPTAEQLVDQAVAADRFDIAVVLATSASKAVAKSKIATHKEVEERLARRRHGIHLIEPIYAAATKAQETLDKNPADPGAILVVGVWRCLYKGDWSSGLPLLAKVSDEKLRSLAQQEINSPTDANQQADLADAWLAFGEKQEGIAAEKIKARAAYWYRKAVGGLTGLAKSKVEKRLETIDEPASLPVGALLIFTFDKSSFTRKGKTVYIKDLSGSGNNGIVHGTKLVDGRVGTALSFSGTGDYVECRNSQSLNPTNGVSICAWVKARTWRWGSLVSKDDWENGGTRGYVLRVLDDCPDFTIGSGGWNSKRDDNRMDLDRWHHVAATYDGNAMTLFVDGIAHGSKIFNRPIAPSPYNLRIGCGTFDTKRDFDGIIDEVAIFGRALTENEIQSVYQMGKQGQSLAK